MSDEMTVGELKGLLEDEPEDAIVRIVHQRSWPLQEILGGVANSRDILAEDEEEESANAEDADERSMVYLVANGHPEGSRDSPYAPSGAWDVMRRAW